MVECETTIVRYPTPYTWMFFLKIPQKCKDRFPLFLPLLLLRLLASNLLGVSGSATLVRSCPCARFAVRRFARLAFPARFTLRCQRELRRISATPSSLTYRCVIRFAVAGSAISFPLLVTLKAYFPLSVKLRRKLLRRLASPTDFLHVSCIPY